MNTGVYKSIELWKEIEIKKGFFGKARIRIKKLNIGESLNYLVNSRAYRLKREKSAIEEILSYSVITKGITIYECDYMRILETIEEISFEKPESGKQNEYNEKWLTGLIAFFGYYCGWTKDDVFRLYFSEVPELTKQIIDSNNYQLDTQRQNAFIAAVCGFSSKPTESFEKIHNAIINDRKYAGENKKENNLADSIRQWAEKAKGR